MFQVKLDESNSTRRRIPVLLVDATDGYTPETGLSTFTVNVSQNGTILGSQSQSLTEVGNGIYYYTLGTGAVNTLGWVTVNVSATGCRQYNAIVQVMAYDAMDVVRLGLTALPNAAAEASGGLATLNAAQSSNGTIPANMVAISGDTTAADNLETAADGGVYNLGGGGIVASSVSGNVGGNVSGSVGSVTGNVGGNVAGSVASVTGNVAGSVNSVTTGVTLANNSVNANSVSDVAAQEIANAVWTANITQSYAVGSVPAANWANNTFGDRVIISDSNNQNEVAITGSNHIAADIHEIQPDEIIDIAQGVLTEATSTTTYAAGDVGNVLGRLVNMIEADGANFRYTANALEEAPTGGGGSTVVTGNLPYRVKADEQFPGGVVDINIGTLMRLDLQIVDRDDNPINLTGGTVTVGVRNASTGATVGTDQSATLSLARLGYIYVDTVADWSATAGTYRITVSATLGSDVIVAGPLQLVVRTR